MTTTQKNMTDSKTKVKFKDLEPGDRFELVEREGRFITRYMKLDPAILEMGDRPFNAIAVKNAKDLGYKRINPDSDVYKV